MVSFQVTFSRSNFLQINSNIHFTTTYCAFWPFNDFLSNDHIVPMLSPFHEPQVLVQITIIPFSSVISIDCVQLVTWLTEPLLTHFLHDRCNWKYKQRYRPSDIHSCFLINLNVEWNWTSAKKLVTEIRNLWSSGKSNTVQKAIPKITAYAYCYSLSSDSCHLTLVQRNRHSFSLWFSVRVHPTRELEMKLNPHGVIKQFQTSPIAPRQCFPVGFVCLLLTLFISNPV